MNSLIVQHSYEAHDLQSTKRDYLLIGFAAAEAKDEQMAMRVSAGKMLAISRELAVKNSTVALPFNLKRKQ